jgi:hypothetical protein
MGGNTFYGTNQRCAGEVPMLKAALVLITSFLIMFGLGAGPVHAQFFNVSPDGSDVPGCGGNFNFFTGGLNPPCRTITYLTQHGSSGVLTQGFITLAPGVYHENVTFSGIILGPNALLEANPCPDPTAATVDNIIAQGVQCLSTQSIRLTVSNPGFPTVFSGIETQGVYQSIVFLSTTGAHVSVDDALKVSCGGNITISGSAAHHIAATNLSLVLVDCNINVAVPGLSFGSLLTATDSVLDLSNTTFSGQPISGLRFELDHSGLTFPRPAGASSIPGSGSKAVKFSACHGEEEGGQDGCRFEDVDARHKAGDDEHR